MLTVGELDTLTECVDRCLSVEIRDGDTDGKEYLVKLELLREKLDDLIRILHEWKHLEAPKS